MRRLCAGMAAALLAAILFFPAEALSAESAVLMDGTTGRFLYEKQADTKRLMASTTKIMTALVVCEQCNVLDRMRIPREAVGIEGSSMYLQEGEILTIQELLYGLMLRSGNDAAVALAIYCGGTVEGFVEQMNDKARQLGLSSTHFANPNGLDSPGHYSSARDLARLASCAMDNPIFAQTVSTKNVTIGERILRNHNKLLWTVEGTDGVKTGFTKAAGRILVSSAVRKGRRLIAVTMNDPDDWNTHKKLLEMGFQRYSVQKIAEKGEQISTAEIIGGNPSRVSLLAAEDFCYALTEQEQPNILLQNRSVIYAPVCQGDSAGWAYVRIGEQTIGRIPLIYGEAAPEKAYPPQTIWEKLFGRKQKW